MTEITLGDLPGGWVAVLGILLSTVIGPVCVLIVTARLSGRVKAIRSDVAITRDHVANSHVDADGVPINMRDEQDSYQNALIGKLDQIQATQRTQGLDIGGIRVEIRQLHAADTEHTRADIEHLKAEAENRKSISDLSRTIPKRPRSRKPKEQQ